MDLTYEALGKQMAQLVGRAKPYSIPAVSDVLQGRGYSAEMVWALAQVLEIEMPPGAVAVDPDTQEWATIGMMLRRLAPEMYDRELQRFRKLVAALQEFEDRGKT